MSVPILSVDAMSVSYTNDGVPIPILHDLSFTIAAGQAVGLVGESGSGKSTAALAVMGLLGDGGRVDTGVVRFRGQSLYDMSENARIRMRGAKISIVFQDPFTSLNPSIRLGRQIAEPLLLHRGLSEAEAHKVMVELLAEVGISDPRGTAMSYPHQLSGGMKQRALIAAALACDPELLILDEPTTALDVTVEAQILELLDRLRRTRSLAILFISHNLGVVSRLCDDICVLYAGRVVEQGRTSRVLSTPRHPYTKGLLAALPRLAHRGSRLSTIPGRLPDSRAGMTGCVFQARCAFSLAQCASDPQVLLRQGEAHLSRCWRSDELARVPWPTTEAAVPGKGVDRQLAESATAGISTSKLLREERAGSPLIEARALQRSFRTGGFFESLSLDFSGSGFPVKYRPRTVRAVNELSLSIAPGEIVGLVGESGCGKSTLGRCMIDLIKPTGGAVYVDGEALADASAMRRRALLGKAQIIFQNPDSSLNPRRTIREAIARPLSLFSDAKGAELDRRVEELLDMVRLGKHYGGRYPHQLSGGEKQRVGIARALATNPAFIVCDEAVSALDVSVQASVLNLLVDLRDSLGIAYLFISHDLSVVSHIADRICVMFGGKIVEDGPADQVLRGPNHPYTAALLAAAPKIGAKPRSTGPRAIVSVDAVGAGDIPTSIPGCCYSQRCAHNLGTVCDKIAPPVRLAENGHQIACHLAFSDLRRMDLEQAQSS